MGIIQPHEAFLAQDYQTLALLFSMMLVVSFLVNAVHAWTVSSRSLLARVHTRPGLALAGRRPGQGLLSALFINDVICLALTAPVVVTHPSGAGLTHPPPYPAGHRPLASNIGSLATPRRQSLRTFYPGLHQAPIHYSRFVVVLGPVALLGLLWLVLMPVLGDTGGRWEGEVVETGPHPVHSFPSRPLRYW